MHARPERVMLALFCFVFVVADADSPRECSGRNNLSGAIVGFTAIFATVTAPRTRKNNDERAPFQHVRRVTLLRR